MTAWFAREAREVMRSAEEEGGRKSSLAAIFCFIEKVPNQRCGVGVTNLPNIEVLHCSFY